MLVYTLLLTLLSVQFVSSAPLSKSRFSDVDTIDKRAPPPAPPGAQPKRICNRQILAACELAYVIATNPTVDKAVVTAGKYIAKEAPIVGHAIHKEAHALHVKEHKLKEKVKVKMHHAGEKVKGFFGKVFHHDQQKATPAPSAKAHAGKEKHKENGAAHKKEGAAAKHSTKEKTTAGHAGNAQKAHQGTNHSTQKQNSHKTDAHAKHPANSKHTTDAHAKQPANAKHPANASTHQNDAHSKHSAKSQKSTHPGGNAHASNAASNKAAHKANPPAAHKANPAATKETAKKSTQHPSNGSAKKSHH